MSRINICFACDDNYAKLCGVSIASILNKAKDSDDLNFYILDYLISEKNKAKFEHLKKIKDCDINFFKIDDERFKNLYLPEKKGYLSIAAYLRFVISSLFRGIDKILYLDCDVIATTSLEELYNTDIEDFYAAMVKDTSSEENCERLQFKNDEIYYNSGVILMNLKKWREDNLEQTLFSTIDEGLDDQDILNIAMKGKIKTLEPKWNWQGKAKYYPKGEKYPNLIHFITAYKPWRTGSRRGYNKEYFKNLKLTPWNNIYEQYFSRYFPNISRDRKYLHICLWGVKTRVKIS